MAETIKGINVVIGAETTGLSKALTDVNKKSRDIQTELKQVDRLLKLDPNNTELVAQKQKLLSEAVSNTKEKLDTLKTAQEQVNQQFEKGEINEGQYRAFQREVAKTEQELQKLEGQLKDTEPAVKSLGEKMTEAGEKFKSAGDKMTGAGKKLSTTVTAPIVGLGALALKAGMDFEAAMSEVQAISGATGDDLAALTKKAKEMGATTKFSASESADALKYMAMAGWDTSKMLDGLDGVMALAAASGEDLGAVSDIVTDSMTAFGLAADQAGKFADILAAASSKSNTNVALLGESFKYVAPVAGALGYSAEDTAVALGLMANAGIKASQSGTSLRSALTNMAKPTKQMQKVINELSLSITDNEGQMKSLDTIMQDLRGSFGGLTKDQQAAYASTLFGKEAMSGMLAIINTSTEDYNNLSSSIYGSAGAAQEMADIMQDNTKGGITQLMSALEGLAIQLSEILMPIFNELISFVRNIVDWLSNLDEGTMNTIVIIAGLAAAIGPLLIILGQVTTAIGALMPVMTALTGPIGLVVAAIAGLVAGITILYNKNEEFRTFIDETWTAIKDIFQQVWQEIVTFVKPIIEDLSNFFQSIFNELKEFWETHGELILSFIKPWLTGIVGFFKVQFEAIKTVISVTWTLIKAIVKTTIESIKLIISTVLDLILGVFQTFVKLLQGDWKGAWGEIKKTAQSIMENIIKFFKNIDLVQVGKDIIGGLIKGIGSMAGAVVDTVKDVANGLVKGIKGALNINSPSKVMEQLGKWTGEGMVVGLKRTINSVSKQASALANAAVPKTQQLQSSSGGVSSTKTFNFEGMFSGAIFNVRNDEDIERIAQRLFDKQQAAARGAGG